MKINKKIEMFVITHKEIFYPMKKGYVPILVGNNKNLDYLRDNIGDNISEKNSNYCELTAMYWLWKNYELPDYVGICHYRRFFVKRPFYTLIDEKEMKKIFRKYDVILPYKYRYKKEKAKNAYEHFIESPSGRKEDIERLKTMIAEEYNEYYEDLISILESPKISYCNMVVMSKENYIKYCEWLFELLFKYEKRTDLSGYTQQEARIYGFLSEFLLNVWIKNKKLKVKYCNILKVDTDRKENLKIRLKLLYRDIGRLLKGGKKDEV